MKHVLLTLFFSLTVILTSLAQQSAVAPAKIGSTYGKSVTTKNVIPVKALEKTLSTKNSYSGKVEGKVVKVCKMSGCYLTLQNSDTQEPIMVRFADTYTVPQNLVGMQVIVDGTAKAKDIADKNNPNKKVRSISFIADGVLVVK